MPPSNDDLIKYARELLARAEDAETWEQSRNILAIAGYPLCDTEDEVRLVRRTIRKAVYPSRSGGIA